MCECECLINLTHVKHFDDILCESFYNSVNLRDYCCFYAAAASADYSALLKSFSIYESLYKMDVNILSDIDVNMKYYNILKKYDKHF